MKYAGALQKVVTITGKSAFFRLHMLLSRCRSRRKILQNKERNDDSKAPHAANKILLHCILTVFSIVVQAKGLVKIEKRCTIMAFHVGLMVSKMAAIRADPIR